MIRLFVHQNDSPPEHVWLHIDNHKADRGTKTVVPDDPPARGSVPRRQEEADPFFRPACGTMGRQEDPETDRLIELSTEEIHWRHEEGQICSQCITYLEKYHDFPDEQQVDLKDNPDFKYNSDYDV